MAKSPNLLRRFFGAIWTLFSVIYKLVVILSVLIVVGLIYMGMKGGAPVTVQDNVALVWHPAGMVVEQNDRDPTEQFFSELAGDGPMQTELRDLTDALEYARDDSRIRMAVLWLDALAYAGPAQLEELRVAINRFKESGKRVVAYAPAYTQRAYYLASQADEVLMDPMGMVFLEGYAVYSNYYPGLLDKLGINMHVFQAGEYKSAVEPFQRSDMSDAAREANRAWLDTLWGKYVGDVAAGRGISTEAVNNYVEQFVDRLDEAEGDPAQVALASELIDELMPLQAVRERIGSTVGMADEHESFRQIDFRRYLKAVRKNPSSSQQVAVVTVQGSIVPGESSEGTAGGDTVSDLLLDARDDDNVAAVVLRVDSPGGGIYPSEQIRRAVLQVQEAGKPVVVSMSTLAASGGYWISAPADRIFAHDTTITGSIGVFGIFPTFENTLEKIGVTTDGVGTTPLAGAVRADRPLSETVHRLIELIISKDYQQFVGYVADGRDMERERVHEIAQGRVWSGLDAAQLGLVDEIGGFEQAVTAAAQAAGLDAENPAVRYLSPPREFSFAFLAPFTQSLSQFDLARAVLGYFGGGAADVNRANGDLQWLEQISSGQAQGMASHCLCVMAADAPFARQQARAGDAL
ncbi:MAG: signal peptide peptidase SppA [Xanthomonadales bacterium]|nr:signal peptide peptidase SppA [Xanthomonadales bacterium]